MASRKVGDVLLDSIYTAALEILNEEGYEACTFSNIAKRAETTRPVLYKRWNTPFELLFDAIETKNKLISSGLLETEINTGSLRGDLIATLDQYNHAFKKISSEFWRAFLFEMTKRDNPFWIINLDFKKGNLFVMERILAQAQLRGEILTTTTDNVKLLPFKLLRYEYFTNGESAPETLIEEMVDQIILPAIRNQQPKEH